MYSPQLLDHFEHPRNAGDLPEADARVDLQNPACGDVLQLALKFAAGRISAARFRAKGCVPAMACASLLTEMVMGRTVAEAKLLRAEDLVQAIGGVPPASGHAAQLAIDALKKALASAPAV